MPCAASDHAALALDATALLAFRDASVRLCAAAVPRQATVVAAPDLVISLSGVCDRAEVPARLVAHSHIANHLVRYLRTVLPPSSRLCLLFITWPLTERCPARSRLCVWSHL
jgi:hypothetical protein